VKCLFLRVRNTPSVAIDEMITKVFAINVNSEQGKRLFSDARNSFGDYRNKYNNSIETYVKSYKELRYSSYFLYFY